MSKQSFLSEDYKRVEAHVQVATALLDNVEKAIKRYSGKGISDKEFLENADAISSLLELSIKYTKQYAEISGLTSYVEKSLEQADKLRKGSEISPVETILGSNPVNFEKTLTGLCKELGIQVPDNVLNKKEKKVKEQKKPNKTDESII